MFRKLNKPQLTKNKQQHFIGIRVFDSRLYLDINEKTLGLYVNYIFWSVKVWMEWVQVTDVPCDIGNLNIKGNHKIDYLKSVCLL
jgi:hypothetical protein